MRQTKYHSHKAQCGSGHMHDSRKEAARCNELHLLQMAGEISGLRKQVKFTLLPARQYIDQPNERAVTYIADFVYNENGITVIEDTKGVKTKDYIIKRKMLKDKYCREQGCIFRET